MRSSLRVRANALDLAPYRRVRSVARTPDTVRWVRSCSRLGEHVGRRPPVIADLPHLMATPTGTVLGTLAR